MKILFITPGSGDNFYCENCMRDRALVKALGRTGNDVMFMPLYLPVELDAINDKVQVEPIFFGGINVYLEQKLALFRWTPQWFNNLFDNRKLLNMAAKKAGMTDPSGLGDMTLSMLQGKHGKQARELGKLIDWLKVPENRPDIVCLSNALLNGIAPAIANELGAKVVCFLQDEDGFVDSLGNYSKRVWQQMNDNSKYVDKYIAVSSFYAGLMQDRMLLPGDKVTYCYSGVELSGYKDVSAKNEGPLTIGFLSRICKSKGFDVLVRAFIELKKRDSLKDIKLLVSGGSIGDEAFIEKQKLILAENGILADVEFMEGFVELSDRIKFLSNVDVVCVPERDAVAHGRYFIESCVAGVPVVSPDSGVFTELADQTDAGLLYNHGNDKSLQDTLMEILSNHDLRKELSSNGRHKAAQFFDIDENARMLIDIFKAV